MILKSIKLHNIRSYTTQRIDFKEGVTLLSGDIGSGKSTILLSIEFALFGLLRSMLSGESLLRKGKNQGFVELGFSIDNKVYSIHRSLRRSKTSVVQDKGHMVIDEMHQAMTAIELKTKVLELLGYPKGLVTKTKSLVYRYTVYTPQEQMKHILFEDKEARLDTLRKVFGIDKYKRVVENAQAYTKVIRQRLRVDEHRAEGAKIIRDLKEQKELALLDIAQQLASMDNMIKDIEVMLQEKKQENEMGQQAVMHAIKLRSELAALQDKVAEKNDLIKKTEHRRSLLGEEMQALDKDTSMGAGKEDVSIRLKSSVDALGKMKKRMADLDERLRSSERLLVESASEQTLAVYHQRALQKSIEEDKKRLEQISLILSKAQGQSYDLQEIASKIAEISQKEYRAKDELLIVQKRLATFEERIDSTKKSIVAIDRLGECPQCLQEVPHEHKQKVSADQEKLINKILQDSEEFRQRESETNVLLKDLASRKEGLAELKTKANVWLAKKESIDQARSQKDQLLARQKVCITDIDSWNTRQEQAKQRSATAQKEIELLNVSKSESVVELQKIESDVSEMQKLQAEKELFMHKKEQLSKKQDQAEALDIEIKQMKERCLGFSQAADVLKDRLKQLGDIEGAFAMVKRELGVLQDQIRSGELKQKELVTRQKDTLDVLETIKKDLEMYRELEENIIDKKRLERWIEAFFVKVAKTIEMQVMHSVHVEFDGMFRKWFAMLIEDELLTARLDSSFTPVMEQNGYDTEVNSLSGGEKTAAALAYRLALNKVINGMVDTIKTSDLLALDEPTDGFSSEQLDKVREVLDELHLRQVLIVSHESKIESFVDHVMRVTKTDHVSKITV